MTASYCCAKQEEVTMKNCHGKVQNRVFFFPAGASKKIGHVMSMQELTLRVVCVCAVLGALPVGDGPGRFMLFGWQREEEEFLVAILL
jgi:hypothetical protein